MQCDSGIFIGSTFAKFQKVFDDGLQRFGEELLRQMYDVSEELKFHDFYCFVQKRCLKYKNSKENQDLASGTNDKI